MGVLGEQFRQSNEPGGQLRQAFLQIEDLNRTLKNVESLCVRLLDVGLDKAPRQLDLLKGHKNQSRESYMHLVQGNRQNEVSFNFDERYELTEQALLDLHVMVERATKLQAYLHDLGPLHLSDELMQQLRGSFRRPMQLVHMAEPQALLIELTANVPEADEPDAPIEPVMEAEEIVAEALAPADDIDTSYVDRLENPWVSEPAEVALVPEIEADSPAIAQVMGTLEAELFPPTRHEQLDIDVPAPEPVADITRMSVVLFNDDHQVPAPRFGNGPARQHRLPPRPRPEDMIPRQSQVVTLPVRAERPRPAPSRKSGILGGFFQRRHAR